MRKKSYWLVPIALVFLWGCGLGIGGDIDLVSDPVGYQWGRWFSSSPRGTSESVSFSGKLVYRNLPVSFAQVSFYDARRVYKEFKKPDFSAETDLRGDFQLELPRGAGFYITAHQKSPHSKIELFAFQGDGPVIIEENQGNPLTLIATAVNRPETEMKTGSRPGIYGRALYRGKPLQGVRVYLYEDSLNAFKKYYLAVTKPTGTDGSFYLTLDPGDYFLVARKRVSSDRAGPLLPGDYYGFYHKNPLSSFPDRVQTLDINLVKIPDYFSRLSQKSDYGKKVARERRTIYPFAEPDSLEENEIKAGLEGAVFSSPGKPAPARGSIFLYNTAQEKETPLAEAEIKRGGLFSFSGLLPGVYYLSLKVGNERQPLFLKSGSRSLLVKYGHQNFYRLYLRP
ncbi:MAG: hypothetical protein ACE5GM_00750 [bacterium]